LTGFRNSDDSKEILNTRAMRSFFLMNGILTYPMNIAFFLSLTKKTLHLLLSNWLPRNVGGHGTYPIDLIIKINVCSVFVQLLTNQL